MHASDTAESKDKGLRSDPFSLASVLSPIALLRARRYVDLISTPRLLRDTALKGSTGASSSLSAEKLSGRRPRGGLDSTSADPELDEFVEVMDTLRQAAREHTVAQRERQAERELAEGSSDPSRPHEEGGTGPHASMAAHGPATTFSPLHALRVAYGDTRGSALHRTWLEAPQRHLARVAEALETAVLEKYVRRFWPVHPDEHACKSEEASACGGAMDWYRRTYHVHVQFLPSTQTRRVGTAMRDAEVIAAVVVRRRATLARLAVEEARLAARYLAAAAEGQTVESALRFWEDVSYPDQFGGEEELRVPLGFDKASRLAQERLATMTAESVDITRPSAADDAARRKRGRDDVVDAATPAGEAPRPVVVLGSEPSGELGSREGQTTWQQPSALLRTVRPTSGTLTRATPQSVRHSGIGLLAVLYVTVQGVAYVGASDGTSLPLAHPLHETSTPVGAATEESRMKPEPAEPASLTLAAQPTVLSQALLPLDSRDSFTRGLLGL